MNWYYISNGTQAGPIDEEALQALVAQGTVGPDDLVWNETLGSEWKKYTDLFPEEAPVIGSEGTLPNREITASARAGLSGRWNLAAGIVLTYLAASFCVSLLGALIPVPLVGNLIALFALPPLMAGASLCFLRLSRSHPVKVENLFDCFNRYWASVAAYLITQVLIFLWLLPGLLAVAVGGGFVHNDACKLFPCIILLAAGVIYLLAVGMMVSLRYAMTFFVLAEDSTVSGLGAVRRSARIMKNKKWKLLCLDCRFIGWTLLAIFFTFGLGMLWVTPYMQTAKARFYDDLK
jgi:uncharacterized membrane protein